MPSAAPPSAAPHAELCTAPAWRQAELLRAGAVSSVELTDAYLDRIAALDGELNAYVTVFAEEARDEAAAADRRRARGAAAGPLDGLPIAVKDLFDHVAGRPNGYGSLPLRDVRPPASSVVVERLQGAGAVILGKTNTAELGHKAATDNRVAGATSTPLEPGANAGGSSGGSAAAVAAGLAACATGSDGAGSLRVPAALCGIATLKPSPGLVPAVGRPNAFRSQCPRASVGPLGRTVRDAALLLSVIAGPHPRDPLAVPVEVGWAEAAQPRRLDGLRVGFSADLGLYPVEPAVAEAAERAAYALAEAGARVEPVRVDLGVDRGELDALLRRMLGLLFTDVLDGLAEHGHDLLRDHRDDLSPHLLELVDGVCDLPAAAAARDDRLRTRILDGIEDALDRCDVLATPTAAVPPFANRDDGATVGPSAVAGVPIDPLFGWCLTPAFNVAGHPAASVPTGPRAPTGLQLVGRRYDDARVLSAAAAVEALTAR